MLRLLLGCTSELDKIVDKIYDCLFEISITQIDPECRGGLRQSLAISVTLCHE
jgi:hypothetical protein